MDLLAAKTYILTRLENELSDNLFYHGVHHTIDVYKSATHLAELEELSDYEKTIIQTAALYHDAGYLFQYKNNEDSAVSLIRKVLPTFGYSDKAIEQIARIVVSTKRWQQPKTLLEKIMNDADYDYLGREDVAQIADNLFRELNCHGNNISMEEWNYIQVKFLRTHRYHTASAIAMRKAKKLDYLNHLISANSIQEGSITSSRSVQC